MGINLGSGFGNLTGNTSNNAPTGGILNLNKNDILDLTKRNPGLKRVMLGAGWDISNNGSDFDLDIGEDIEEIEPYKDILIKGMICGRYILSIC